MPAGHQHHGKIRGVVVEFGGKRDHFLFGHRAALDIERARPWQLGKTFERLRRHLPAATPVVFGRAVGRADERVTVTTLANADAADADMATLIIIGSATTRVIAREGQAPLVYTPRTGEVSA